MKTNIMVIDSTFWVAVSFFIFLGGLVYLRVPQKVNTILNKLITDIAQFTETTSNKGSIGEIGGFGGLFDL